MKQNFISLLIHLFLPAVLLAQTNLPFDRFFVNKTMRMDYYHTGTNTEDIYSLDEFIEESVWAGTRVNLIDPFDFGKYMVKVYDLEMDQLIFSHGYSTLFGEWQTTDEATKTRRTLGETVVFPYPKEPVTVVIATRDAKNNFQNVFSTEVDPNSRFVNREYRQGDVIVVPILENGTPSRKVDLVIIGDGYTAQEMEKYRRDVRRFIDLFFNWSPFKERKNDFNVWAIEAASQDSGPDEPRKGIFKNTPLGCSFNTFDSARYLTTTHNKEIRDIAGNAPYDAIIIMVNTSRYGGGGIYNFFSIFISDNEYDEYVFVHEFGHGFAGLGDEYYTSSVSYSEFYPRGVEPWEANITALLDPDNVKWKDLVTPGTPIPTPDDPEKYGSVVGAFEGAGYAAKELYRPAIDCKMFSKAYMDFDPVCMQAVNKMIDYYTK